MRHLALALFLACAAAVACGTADAVTPTVAAPAPAPARHAPAGSGIRVGVPAYVPPGDPLEVDLLRADPPAALVIVNADNGDAPFDPTWQAQADRLRAHGSRVIGYVHTDYAKRPVADVEASADDYLRTADGRPHVDGIFFDTTTTDCGSAAGLTDYRDYYLALRDYVRATMRSVRGPHPLVVDNPGLPVADCYLAPGTRTADTFVTFEGDAGAYGAWAGGNVVDANGFRPGAEYGPTSFWHLVFGVPDEAAGRAIITTARARGAGYVYATDVADPNQWSVPPSWGYGAETAYARGLGGPPR